MKNFNLKLIIPALYLAVIFAFTITIKLIIGHNTQGQNGLYEFIYTLTFFISKPVYTIIYMIILLSPIGLLIYSSIKKSKHLFICSIICCAIGLTLYALTFILN